MNTTIGFGEGNTSGVMSPLIPFNCVFDTDFGLLNLIYRSYFDSSVFSVEFFSKNHIVKNMVNSLVEREEENPLSICILPEKKELADELYNDFIKEKYKDILELSMPTEVYNTLELFKLAGDIKPTIIYEKEEEIEILNSFNVTKKLQRMNISEVKEVNIFEQFYFKSINDFYCQMLCEFIEAKAVYIANYKFNVYEKGIRDNRNTLVLGIGKNQFRVFDIYSKSKLKGE